MRSIRGNATTTIFDITMKVTLLQTFPQEPTLLLLSLTAMTFFAVLATIGIFVFSSKKIYKYWAVSTLLFTFAWIPSTIIYDNIFYLGTLGDVSIRITAVFLLLRGFQFKPIMKLERKYVRILALAIILGIYTILMATGLPAVMSSVVVLPLMGLATFNAGRHILSEISETKLQVFSGVSFYFWSASCFLLTGYVFFSELYPLSYLQSTGLSLTNMMLFLMYIEDTRREVEEHLNISQVLGSLITHDLRNYLNIAYAALDLIDVEDEENYHYLTMAEDSLHSALKFMKNSRKTVRSLAIGDLDKEEIDIIQMLRDIRIQIINEHDLDESSLVLDVKDQHKIIESPILSQIIWNILDNAVVHAKVNPKITMTIIDDDALVLQFQDNAGGLNDEIKRCIIESCSESGQLGIGLNIVIRLTKLLEIDLVVRDNIQDDKIIGSIMELELTRK